MTDNEIASVWIGEPYSHSMQRTRGQHSSESEFEELFKHNGVSSDGEQVLIRLLYVVH